MRTFNEEQYTEKMRASDVKLHQTVLFENRKVMIPVTRLRPPQASYRQRGLRQSIMNTVQPSMANAFDPHKVQIAGIISRVDGGDVDVANLTKRGLEKHIDEYVFLLHWRQPYTASSSKPGSCTPNRDEIPQDASDRARPDG